MKALLRSLLCGLALCLLIGDIGAGNRLMQGRHGAASATQATATPLIDYANSPASATGQFTFAWFAPTVMGDGTTAVSGTPSYIVYFGTNQTEVEKGPSGTGTTARTKSAGVLSHNETSLAANTYYAVVTAVLGGEESYESPTRVFTVN